MSALLERPLLGVRPHPARELLRSTTDLQVGWIVGERFLSFAACKDDVAFESFLAGMREKFPEGFDVRDMRSNDQAQARVEAGESRYSESPRTEG